MILRYDSDLKEWKHEAKADQNISFGFNNVQVEATPSSSAMHENTHRFLLRNKDGNAGPLIGIMAAMSKKMALTGNGPLFKALHDEVVKRKGMIVVFPPETLTKDSISGVTFIPDIQKWIPVKTPLPHLVYNRVPFRKAEQIPAFSDAAKYLTAMGIPFFNPTFINKNKLYSLFVKHPLLQGLMPESIPVRTLNQLALFLDEHHGIYLKPASSSKGIGIFRLRKVSGQVEFFSHSQKQVYPSLNELWNVYSQILLKHEYIAQKEISPKPIAGNRFDFRVLAHDGKNGYQVTGIGIRQSKKQDLTTHLPKGGILLPYENFRNEKHDEFFTEIVKVIGELLTNELGYFGEFSIDAGVAQNGDYVIYEVNSKPMSFDEPEIEEKRIAILLDLFFRKTGF